MGTCLIFCAGACNTLLTAPEQEDHILVADGGLRHTQALGICPHEILGDFDSLGYIPPNATVHPVEKDDTDAMLAARRGLEKGFREFWFYGSLDGPRLDHTVANFQMLQYLADQGAAGYLIGESQLATVVKNSSLTFPAAEEGIVSVFSLTTSAAGVTIRGLQYGMERGTLTSGFPLGVSNHFIGEKAAVSVEDGSLLVIWDRAAGMPERGETL